MAVIEQEILQGESSYDAYETDPDNAPICANEADDDGDRRTDWPDDPECVSAGHYSENKGRLRACVDGIDNDEDGAIDFRDPGCADALDDNETDADMAPECSDGADNDEDGATDWPDEVDCAAQGDPCEGANQQLCRRACVDLETDDANCGFCGKRCDNERPCRDGFCGGLTCGVLGDAVRVDATGGIYQVDTRGRESTGSRCNNSDGPQVAFALSISTRSRVTALVESASYDTYLQLRRVCDDDETTFGCDDDSGVSYNARIQGDLNPGHYYVLLDGFRGAAGTARVRFTLQGL